MRALAPVRRPVPLRRGRSAEGRAQLKALLGVEQVSLFKSATQALQAVLTHCAGNQSSLRNEVILPAYGCPDLLSACLGAGLKPRMVDILGDGWGYCQAGLLAALSPATIAPPAMLPSDAPSALTSFDAFLIPLLKPVTSRFSAASNAIN